MLREAAGLPQHALAKRAGITQPTVSLAERGWASRTTLKKLAGVLGLADPASLMDLVELAVARSTPAPPPADRLPAGRHDHRDKLGRFAPLLREDDRTTKDDKC